VSIRDEMAAACGEETVAFTRVCRGRVALTEAHLASARGADEAAKRLDILADARLGCAQKCGCLRSVAEFETVDGTEYVVARCRDNPNTMALGSRIEPDPGRQT